MLAKHNRYCPICRSSHLATVTMTGSCRIGAQSGRELSVNSIMIVLKLAQLTSGVLKYFTTGQADDLQAQLRWAYHVGSSTLDEIATMACSLNLPARSFVCSEDDSLWTGATIAANKWASWCT